MIKVRTKTNFEPLDKVQGFLENYDAQIEAAANIAYQRVKPGLEDDLGYVPPKVKYPIQWTSEKQRRYYFAVVAVYDPSTNTVIPYRETGQKQIVHLWKTSFVKAKFTYSLIITNPSEKAKYVYGSTDFRKKTGPYPPMQQFHINTGWVPIQETALFWFDAFNEEFYREYTERLSAVGKFTKSNRSR